MVVGAVVGAVPAAGVAAAVVARRVVGTVSPRCTSPAPTAAVNQLAGRIEELLVAERESVADLAHRLRTPLTALQLDAEALPPAGRDRVLDGVDAVGRAVDDVIREARRPRVPAEDLAAALDALIGNVFAHTPDGTGLVLGVRPRAGGAARVTVRDDGPGLPEAAVDRARAGHRPAHRRGLRRRVTAGVVPPRHGGGPRARGP
ncbi:histidine kinase dimerization/phospho-acceptor domain-containing protein [Geodermatophilus sp. SYSU D01045]